MSGIFSHLPPPAPDRRCAPVRCPRCDELVRPVLETSPLEITPADSDDPCVLRWQLAYSVGVGFRCPNSCDLVGDPPG